MMLCDSSVNYTTLVVPLLDVIPKNIWKAQGPPKAKNLVWQICKDCLPTRMHLRNHRIQCQMECPSCLQASKEEWHVLLECEGSREAWNAMRLNHITTPRLQLFNNIKELIFDICYKESKEIVGKI
jgi:hypothetical protein